MSKPLIFAFVQLGESKAPWLFKNMERTRALFPDNEVLLISNNSKFIRRASKMGFRVYEHTIPSYIDELLEFNNEESEFRGNFWRYSLERLLALSLFQIQETDSPVLHVESDVMLLNGFPVDKISEVRVPMWLSANIAQDCAALFFIPDKASARWFMQHALKNIEEDTETTDMKLLIKIRLQNLSKVQLFPTSTQEIYRSIPEKKSERLDQITGMIKEFEGIFDVAGMGIWLSGINPRNTGGWVRRYDNSVTGDNNFFPTTFHYRGHSLYVGSSPPIKVYCLHIHSKNKILLSTRGERELVRLVQESHTLSKEARFSLLGWLTSAYDIYISVGKRFYVTLFLLVKGNIIWDRVRTRFPVLFQVIFQGVRRGKKS